MKLILASASPRRKELLEQIGMSFCVIPAKGEEVITKKKPQEVVMELSEQKAAEVADGIEEPCIVIGADTVVAADGKILGKPKNEEDALAMLWDLQGRKHEVYTGVTLYDTENGTKNTFYEKTDVYMYPATKEELISYIKTGEPMDKAGAYGIQGMGAKLVEKINGDYNNVVGLPVARLFREINGKFVEK